MDNYGYFTFQIGNNKGADQTAQMCRLVCALVVRKQQSQGFSHRGPYVVEVMASWPPPGYAPVTEYYKDRNHPIKTFSLEININFINETIKYSNCRNFFIFL